MVLQKWVELIWYPNAHPSGHLYPLRMLLFVLLLPFSLLYSAVSLLIQYTTVLKQHISSGYRSPVPVVVVGNFTVGGTGKTPLVAYLFEQLKQQGFQPGIVSRGYGRKTTGVLVLKENLSPQAVGDEALLTFQLTKGPMVVGSNRNHAIQALLSSFPQVNVVISDDGLQHVGLEADIRILVVDAMRGFGNGCCLPAGPLRAPIRVGRFSQVDMVVINETAIRDQNNKLALDILSVPQYHMCFETVGFIKITTQAPYRSNASCVSISDFIKAYGDKHIHAIAGIGNPSIFFQSLENLQLSITRHIYPDHHNFKPEDLIFNTTDPIIMTEKDAVKCAPWLSRGDCWALKIRVTIEERFSGMVGQLIKEVGPRAHRGNSDD